MKCKALSKRCDVVEGYYVNATNHLHKNGINEHFIIMSASGSGWFVVRERCAIRIETLCLPTNVPDKNGKLLFTGDIILYKDDYYSYIGIVQYTEKIGCFASMKNYTECHFLSSDKIMLLGNKNLKLAYVPINIIKEHCRGYGDELNILGDINETNYREV